MDMRTIEMGDEETLSPWHEAPRLKHLLAGQRLLLSVAPNGVDGVHAARVEVFEETPKLKTAESRDSDSNLIRSDHIFDASAS